jgi:hypothetical protein
MVSIRQSWSSADARLHELFGHVRDYIAGTCVGGRVMTLNNERIAVTGQRVSDYDAVAMYPSAQRRLADDYGGFVTGAPKVWYPGIDLSKATEYFLDIRILDASGNPSLPITSRLENGSRHWTNDNVGTVIGVDRITLEDLVTYRKIKYDILSGYYFDSKRNNRIGEVIKYIFNERQKMKAESNPMQQVYKLFMNSAYGKNNQATRSRQRRVTSTATPPR